MKLFLAVFLSSLAAFGQITPFPGGGAVAATSADVIGLFSSCTGTKVLAADGTCVTSSGSPAGALTQFQSYGTGGVFQGVPPLKYTNYNGGCTAACEELSGFDTTTPRLMTGQGYFLHITGTATDTANGDTPSRIGIYDDYNYSPTHASSGVHWFNFVGRQTITPSGGATVLLVAGMYVDAHINGPGVTNDVGFYHDSVYVATGVTLNASYGSTAYFNQAALQGTSTYNTGYMSGQKVTGMTNYQGFSCCTGPYTGTYAAAFDSGVAGAYPVKVGAGSYLTFNNVGGIGAKNSSSGTDYYIYAGDWATPSTALIENGAATTTFMNFDVGDYSGAAKAFTGGISGRVTIANAGLKTYVCAVCMSIGSPYGGAGSVFGTQSLFDGQTSFNDSTVDAYGFRYRGNSSSGNGTVTGREYGISLTGLHSGTATYSNASYGIYQPDTSNVLNLFGGLTTFSTGLITTPFAVASLPAAPVVGQREFVNDSNAVSCTAGIGAVAAAGGTTKCPVFYDGTNWRIG